MPSEWKIYILVCYLVHAGLLLGLDINEDSWLKLGSSFVVSQIFAPITVPVIIGVKVSHLTNKE